MRVHICGLYSQTDRHTHTHTHTHTQDNYCNPRCACMPRVNNELFMQMYMYMYIWMYVEHLIKQYIHVLHLTRIETLRKNFPDCGVFVPHLTYSHP